MINKFKQLALFVAVNLIWIAQALSSPEALTYQGRILKADGTGLEYNNVSFIFEITSSDGACTLFREQRDGVNMANSKGVFDVPIGSNTRLFPDPTSFPSYKLSDSFVNGVTHNCYGSGTWTALSTSNRLLKVQFFDGVGWQQISPENTIRSVPFALTARSATQLGDKTLNDFVLKSNAPGAACSAGQVVFWDGTNFSCVTDAGGAGVISDVLAGTGISVTGTTSKTVAVTFGTTAGTVAQGNDSRIANALQSSTVFAGDVSGTASSISVDRIKGVTVDSTAPTTGQVLRYDGAKWAAATPTAGTVTSVGVSVPSFLSASGGPITSSGTISISLASQTGNTVFAAPNGSSGAPTFRTLGIADIFSSIGGLSFLNTTPSCAAGSALTYISATDRIQCASIAVGTANIADNAITTAKIADGAVTAAKLGSDVGAWTVSSGNVSRTTGTVGVGTSATSSVLTVGATSLTWPNFGLDVLGSNTSDLVRFKNIGSDALVHIVADNGRSSALRFIEDGVGEYVIGRDGADDKFKIAFGANIAANNLMTVTSSGLIGFGNSSPATSLDLSSKTDAIYFPKGTTAQQPSSPAAGMIRYNTDNNATEFYNGTSWINLAAITSGGTMTNVSTITGGASGINISAGGTNQNVTLTASGTGTVTTGSVMTITNATASTAYNNGALVVSGGIGVSGNINSNGNIYSKGLQVDGSIIKSGSGDLIINDQAGVSERDLHIYKWGNTASFRSDLAADSDQLGTFAFYGASSYFSSKIGIGVASPSDQLSINTSGGGTTTQYLATKSVSNPAPYALGSGLLFGWGSDTNGPTIRTVHGGDYNNAGLGFSVLTSSVEGEAMRILHTGNVGIGTTLPQAKLEIKGTRTGTITPSNSIFKMGGSDVFLFGGAGDGVGNSHSILLQAMRTSDAVPFPISMQPNGGKVGVGTMNPSYKFDVVDTASDSVIAARSFTNTANASGVFIGARARGSETAPSHPLSGDNLASFVGRNALNPVGWPGMIIYSSENQTSSAQGAEVGLFSTPNGTTGALERMRIAQNGNVGIGTTSPSSKLEVNGGGGGPGMVFKFSEGSAAENPAFKLFRWTGTATNYWPASIELNHQGDLGFKTGSEGTIAAESVSSKLTILNSGNVGIGTTSPGILSSDILRQNILEVSGKAVDHMHSSGVLSLSNNRLTPSANDIAGVVTFGSENNVSSDVAAISSRLTGSGGANGFGGDLRFFTKGDNIAGYSERVRIDSSGNVGIGTTAPSEMLEVAGNVKATSYLYTSDARLKKDVREIASASEKIQALRGVEFKWKSNDREDVGFIAQEVEKVFPQLVKTDNVTGYKSVQYGNIVAVLVEAVKDLFNRQDASEAEIQRLKAELDQYAEMKKELCLENPNRGFCRK